MKTPDDENGFVRMTSRTASLIALTVVAALFTLVAVVVVFYRGYSDRGDEAAAARAKAEALQVQLHCLTDVQADFNQASGVADLARGKVNTTLLELLKTVSQTIPGDPNRAAVITPILNLIPGLLDQQDSANAKLQIEIDRQRAAARECNVQGGT